MNIKVYPSDFSGCFEAPSSKSETHRLLIAAFLSGGKYSFRINFLSEDILATLSCLEALGAEYYHSDGILMITRSERKPSCVTLDCKGSGSTLRFLLPLAAALTENATFLLNDSLKKRPVKELLKQLETNGCQINEDTLKISGPLNSGSFSLPGNISSQYFSGLLFALPLLEGDSVIISESPILSGGYTDMTLDVLKKSGVKVVKDGNRFLIPGRQKYSLSHDVSVGGDWSNSSLLLALGAVNKGISVKGLDIDSVQPDKKILHILKSAGADYSEKDGVITVLPAEKLRPLILDASDTPDLVPVLAALCAFAEGKSVISGISKLRLKESDRLETTANVINSLGGNCRIINDNLVIFGKKMLSGGIADPVSDHREVEAAMLMALLCKKPSMIKDADSVNKSFPEFFDIFRGHYDIVNNRK